MKNILLASIALAGAVALGATPGRATVFGGSASFTDNGPAGNGVSFSAQTIDNPFSTGSLSAGQSQTFTDFATIVGTDNGSGFLGSNQSYTDSVTLSLAFTTPENANDSQGGSGNEQTYNTFFGLGANVSSGSLVWTGSQNGFAQDLVTFTDGAQAYVDFYNTVLTGTGPDSVSGKVEIKIVDVKDPISTPVPEPASLALLGLGLVGVGFVVRRRSSVAAA